MLGAVAALALCGAAGPGPPAAPKLGELIYREGQLAPGQPLIGEREGALSLEGSAAACANCHRRSGLGTVEGRIVIPPITGRYLFRPGERVAPEADSPHGGATPPDRSAYDNATLARAIREGAGADGRPLDYLMPRFRLDDAAMQSLIAHLRQLSSGRVPGVIGDVLHFGTVITPDADPAARAGMLNVLEQYFESKNAFYRGDNAPPLQRARRIHFRVQRRWQLHVWQLSGPPETWEAQLAGHLRTEPVYAVISGLGGATWAPVHRFCERAAIPCLLPNVDLPVVAEGDFYPVYFSRGVLLEAQLIAARLAAIAPGATPPGAAPPGAVPRRIVQVFRENDVGAAAAAALHDALAAEKRNVVSRPLKRGVSAHELARSLANTGEGDAIVLWLRAADLAELPPPAARVAAVYVSGLMGGLENAPLPAAWRATARMTYPYELPDLRRVRMNYPLGWFRIRNIPVVAERVQTDTYIACSVVAETLSSMLDDFVRDYLVERVEVMLSSRIINGYFPRLGLAPGQRFASKGGYLVHFTEAQGTKVSPDSDWIVPE